MQSKDQTALPLILLAAGRSSRMRGQDKLLQQVEGRALIRRQADIARAATTGPVYVTLPPDAPLRHAALAGCDVQILSVPEAARGMSASLRRGLEALPKEAPGTMILLADLPELTASDLKSVAGAVDFAAGPLIWRGATAEGAPGHPIVFARAVFPELMALEGDTGGAEVVKKHRDRMVLIPLPGQHALRDLDTPEEWVAWRTARQSTDRL